jgi:hypothetical protein
VNLYLGTTDFLQKKVFVRELTFRSYRNLLKCLIEDEPSDDVLFKNFNIVITETTDLTLEQIYNLTYIDYFLLLLYIRAYSLGDKLNLLIHDEVRAEQTLDENNDIIQKPLNVDLPLEETVQKISHEIKQIQDQTITYNNITVQLQIPSIFNIKKISSETKQPILSFFINKIQINNRDILFSKLTPDEIEVALDKLPVNLFITLKQKVQNLISNLNNLNFFITLTNEHFNKTLSILPNWKSLFFILKLVYNNSLENIYDHIFILTKTGNFSASYLDTCSPGEVFLYMKKLEESYSQKQPAQNTDFLDDNNDEAFDSLFDDLPPVNQEMPNSDFKI